MSWFARLLALALLAASPLRAAESPALDAALLKSTLEDAARLPRLHALIVARNGTPIVERVFRGPKLDTPVNIKSASKTIIAALVGAAIERGVLKDTSQKIVPLLGPRAPPGLDARVQAITLEHLLTMRAGLQRTSGEYYGRWVNSPNWVRYALTRPFEDVPGGSMLYSTGNTHLLSAILTEAAGRSTLELARDWLGKPLKIAIAAWTRDPQGLYLGGNEMALSPRALLRFGELYRQRGMIDGTRVLPERWVAAAFTPKTRDRGEQFYGYAWFIVQAHGYPVYYAWVSAGRCSTSCRRSALPW